MKSIDELNEPEQLRLDNMKQEFRRKALKEWPQTVISSVKPFTKPHLWNGQEMVDYCQNGGDVGQIYAAVFICKPGRQFAVFSEDGKKFV